MTAASTAELLDYDEVIARYDPVMGMEVHVELSTATKMFCGCANEFGAEPNTQVCPVCLGLPGSLPVLNQSAVESAIRIGLALNCEIAPWGRFARKNYFYPISRRTTRSASTTSRSPINGYLDVPLDDGTTWRVEIERAHMEEDTGKLTHLGSDTGRIEGATTSLLDYNRAGVPLIEIVTRPIEGTGERAPEIARAYVTALRDLLRGLGRIRRADGSGLDALRLQRVAQAHRRDRVRHPHRDQERQLAQERRGGGPLRDAPAGSGSATPAARSSRRPGTSTRTATPSPGRSKETAQDYRYFPEPDLEPVAPERRTRRAAAGHHPRAAVVAAQPDSAGLGHLRRGDARPGQQRRHRPGHRHRRRRARPARPPARGGATSWCRRPTRPASSSTRLAITPDAGRRRGRSWSTTASCRTSWPVR